MAVSSSPEPRRISKPSWLDLRLVFGVLLVIVAVLIGAVVVSRASRTNAVVSATRELAAGTVLRGEDVRIVQARLPDRGDGVYLDDTNQAIGKVLSRAVARGELVPLAAVTVQSAHTTLTVPFASGAAPPLRSGQRIEVWLSTESCAPVVLLPGVTVQSVQSAAGSISAGGVAQNVVIDVESGQASRVIAALAIENAQIRAGVLSGPTATPTATPTVGPTAAPAPAPTATGPGQLPADLAACASPSASR